MVGKNNRFLKNSQNGQKYQRFSLRKLSIGVVSVAIAAGFYFDNLTSVQADTVTSGSSQAVVANQGSQTNINSQSVVLGSAAQAVESTTQAVESTTPEQSSASASTATASTSSQGSTAPQVNQTTDGTTQVTDDNYAQNVSLNMYAQNKSNNRVQISANGHQVVGINGSFELTEEQLTKHNSIIIGTITQKRPGQDNKSNIPVLVRTQMHPITITQEKIRMLNLLRFILIRMILVMLF